MTKRPHRRIAELCTALLLGAISFQLTSCGRTSAGAAEPTPPEVEVVTVEQRDIPIYREWIGTLDGLVNAAICSQVTGYQLDLRQIKLNDLLSVVQLYKSLGGGWQS